jgi:hypothetical protein
MMLLYLLINRNRAKLVVALTLVGMLGCGGGAESDRSAASPFAAHSGGFNSTSPISLPGTEGRRRVQATQGTINAELLLDWAERSYADLFPKGPVTQRLAAGGVTYTVRYYPGTGNYVGITDDGGVWGYGPFTGNKLQSYGQMAEYTCLVSPRLCEAPPTVCKTEIATGFTGDLNATYANAGVGADGGADGGSAGVGGSEGKVLGGRIKVIRLADGAVLAEGVTDSVQGLTTLRWCKADMPVMLEMRGAPGAKYFDEAVNDLVDFPLTQKLRALVDRFDENVGVSALTEAAYLYAMNNIANDPAPIKAGTKQVVTDGVPIGMTALQVAQANDLVLKEVNRHFTDRLHQTSMKALATPVDQRSKSSALPRNRYGQAAALGGGFAKVASSYNFIAPAPALAFAGNLALDFSDGAINGLKLDGRSVNAGSTVTFNAFAASENWTVGQGVFSRQYGFDTTLNDGEPYVDGKAMSIGTSANCPGGGAKQGNYYLSKVGRIVALSVTPTGGCGGSTGLSTDYDQHFLEDVRNLSVESVSSRIFAIKFDGSVYGWGWALCGRLGNGITSESYVEQPVKIDGIEKIVAVTTSNDANFALSADGRVFSWGADRQNMLGHGNGPFDLVCSDRINNYTVTERSDVNVILTPRPIAGLDNIVSISGSNFMSAIRADGTVFQWGWIVDDSGSRRLQTRPVEIKSVAAAQKISTTSDMTFALLRDGSVVGWGYNYYGSFGDDSRDIKMPPQPVPGLTGIADMVSDGFGFSLALKADGSILVWGGYGSRVFSFLPTPGSTFKIRGKNGEILDKLPRAVRLTTHSGFVAFVSSNNDTYYFTPGGSIQGSSWNVSNLLDNVPFEK